MTFWTARNLRSVTGGQWLRIPTIPEGEPLISSLSTDTRSVRPGEGFLALRGERFDAHGFLDSASAAGASLLIVDRPEQVPPALLTGAPGPCVLRVPDTLKALGQLGAAYRKTLDGTRVIAVVGSNGKTTVTRLIHAALGSRWRGTASPKSFNNEVGVPLTILSARPGDQYLVCEVGSNHPGETARLGGIVQPDIAVITSVGRDHAEFFEDRRAIVREHAAILTDLRRGGTAVVPMGEEGLAEVLRRAPGVVRFGSDESADVRVTGCEHVQQGERASLRVVINGRFEVLLPLVGSHNALNAAAAFAVARRLGFDEASILSGLASAAPADMRLNQATVRGVRLLIDCYNANPESVIAAGHTLGEVGHGATRRVIVLGEMLEMGPASAELHREVGAALAMNPGLDLLITVCDGARHAGDAAKQANTRLRVEHFPALEEGGAQRIAALLRAGDAVLLKASRGVRLERVAHALGEHETLVSTRPGPERLTPSRSP